MVDYDPAKAREEAPARMSDALRYLNEYDAWRDAQLKKPLQVTPVRFLQERRQQEAVETLAMLAMRLNLCGDLSADDGQVMLSEIISAVKAWESGGN